MIHKASKRLLWSRLISLAHASKVLVKESLAKLEMPLQGKQADREFYRTARNDQPAGGTLFFIFPGIPSTV
jgi:hypothetical protein